MVKRCKNSFAASPAKQSGKHAHVGRHVNAKKMLKEEISTNSQPIKVRRNQKTCSRNRRANIIAVNLDAKMQSTYLKDKGEIYYNDPEGIDMTYPDGLTVIPLEKLRLVTDNTDANNFNVFLGF